MTSPHDALAAWVNFYLITGTAAATLTGLQFIVQSLVASNALVPVVGEDPGAGIAAFGSPTVVHFAFTVIDSAVLCAPWPSFLGLRITLGVLSSLALLYSFNVVRRARRQQTYATTMYDWTWHVIFPAVAYGALLLSAILLGQGAMVPFFTIGGATLLMLCVGIHNSWDTVTYLTIEAIKRIGERERRQAAQAPQPKDASKHSGPSRRGPRR